MEQPARWCGPSQRIRNQRIRSQRRDSRVLAPPNRPNGLTSPNVNVRISCLHLGTVKRVTPQHRIRQSHTLFPTRLCCRRADHGLKVLQLRIHRHLHRSMRIPNTVKPLYRHRRQLILPGHLRLPLRRPQPRQSHHLTIEQRLRAQPQFPRGNTRQCLNINMPSLIQTLNTSPNRKSHTRQLRRTSS